MLSPLWLEVLHTIGAIASLVAAGLGAGRLARLLGQPAVVGEMLAGIAVGPTVLGHLAPVLGSWFHPGSGHVSQWLSFASQLGLLAFVFSAGAEIGAPALGARARRIFAIASCGFLVPVAAGVVLASALGGPSVPDASSWFVGVALAVSALPVITRTLEDLDLLATPFGATVVGSVVITDVVAWIGLTAIAATVTTQGPLGDLKRLASDLVLFVFFVGLLLPARWRARLAGDEAPRTAMLLRRGGAILYFTSAGLRIDLTAALEPVFTTALLLTAIGSKTIGSFLGARFAGIPARDAAGIGAAMNSRGAMEIVFATTGVELGLVNERTYASLIVLAIGTSIMSGPLLRWLAPDPSLGEATLGFDATLAAEGDST